MRILYHHRTTASDGSAVHIEGLVRSLRDLGAEVAVVAPSIASDVPGQGVRSSRIARIRRNLPPAAHELGEFAYNLREMQTLARVARNFGPNLIYQRSNLFLLSGAVVAARLGLPLIEEVNAPYFIERSQHGGIAWSSLARWSERTAWQRASAVVAVSKVLAEIVAREGVSPDRLHVMPNGVDTSLLEPTAIVLNAKERLGLGDFTVLGFTGFVREWNGLEPVIDALARPEGQRWFLLVVGDGPARWAIEARARAAGVNGRLRFTGVLKREEVPEHVSAFDVALQPAANAYASPLKLVEYLALGRAIVAPDQPNIREILTDNEDAVLFTPHRPDAFAEAVIRLASDEPLRRRLSEAARATIVRKRLTWRNNATRVLELARRLELECSSRSVVS